MVSFLQLFFNLSSAVKQHFFVQCPCSRKNSPKNRILGGDICWVWCYPVMIYSGFTLVQRADKREPDILADILLLRSFGLCFFHWKTKTTSVLKSVNKICSVRFNVCICRRFSHVSQVGLTLLETCIASFKQVNVRVRKKTLLCKYQTPKKETNQIQ